MCEKINALKEKEKKKKIPLRERGKGEERQRGEGGREFTIYMADRFHYINCKLKLMHTPMFNYTFN